MVYLAQTVAVGGAQGQWFLDPEYLNEGVRLDVFPAPFPSF